MRSIVAFLLLAAPALAEPYQPITDRTAFVDIIANHELRLNLYNLRLTITPKGQITGRALAGRSPAAGHGKTAISAARWIGAARRSPMTAS